MGKLKKKEKKKKIITHTIPFSFGKLGVKSPRNRTKNCHCLPNANYIPNIKSPDSNV